MTDYDKIEKEIVSLKWAVFTTAITIGVLAFAAAVIFATGILDNNFTLAVVAVFSSLLIWQVMKISQHTGYLLRNIYKLRPVYLDVPAPRTDGMIQLSEHAQYVRDNLLTPEAVDKEVKRKLKMFKKHPL